MSKDKERTYTINAEDFIGLITSALGMTYYNDKDLGDPILNSLTQSLHEHLAEIVKGLPKKDQDDFFERKLQWGRGTGFFSTHWFSRQSVDRGEHQRWTTSI